MSQGRWVYSLLVFRVRFCCFEDIFQIWLFRSIAELGICLGLQPGDLGPSLGIEKNIGNYMSTRTMRAMSLACFEGGPLWHCGWWALDVPLDLSFSDRSFAWDLCSKYHVDVTLSKGMTRISTSETEPGGQNRFESPKLFGKGGKNPCFIVSGQRQARSKERKEVPFVQSQR